MTHKEMSENYRQFAVKVANMYANMEVMRDSCKLMSEAARDAGGPWGGLEEALLVMGGVLASLVLYADEYGKEAKGKK